MSSRTITNSGAEILPENKERKSFIVQNEDASIDIFIMREPPGATDISTTNHDHLIAAGGNFIMNHNEDGLEMLSDRWTVIAASGTPRISFFETEDIRR